MICSPARLIRLAYLIIHRSRETAEGTGTHGSQFRTKGQQGRIELTAKSRSNRTNTLLDFRPKLAQPTLRLS